MKNIIIAGILGGIAMFIWGAISWMAIPWHDATITSLLNENPVLEAFQNTPTGTYYFPGMPEGTSQTDWEAKYKSGPIGLVFIRAEGTDPMAPGMFIAGIMLNIIMALIITYILSQVVNQLGSYGKRVLFITLIGFFGAFGIYTMMWNWFYVTVGYTVVGILDFTFTSLVGSLVIAWKIKPPA